METFGFGATLRPLAMLWPDLWMDIQLSGQLLPGMQLECQEIKESMRKELYLLLKFIRLALSVVLQVLHRSEVCVRITAGEHYAAILAAVQGQSSDTLTQIMSHVFLWGVITEVTKGRK